MGVYELALGIGTIVFISIVWIVLMHAMNISKNVFTSTTPSSFFNVSVNQTEIGNHYDLAKNSFYFSYFFVVFVVIVWIIKKTTQHQKIPLLGG